MTKMKSKKMTKSTFAIIIMAVVMVALLAFGGTYAYFTASAKSITSDTITFGEVKLSTTDNSAISLNAQVEVVPGAEVATGLVKVQNDATVKTYIAAVMDVTYTGAYYTYDADTQEWTKSVTDYTAQKLTPEQISEAFSGLTVNAAWTQCGTAKNVYMLGSDAAGYDVETTEGDVLFLGTAGDPTNTTADINVKNFNRHYAEVNTAEEEQPPVWEMKLQIPLKNGAADWEEDDVYLAWEGARVTISFVAHQIQAQGISVTGSGTEGAILANDVWTAIQGPLNLA